jgi:hypothetical protein
MQPFLKYVLLWLLPFFLHADFVNWLGDYNVAYKRALQEKKPLLVLVVKSGNSLSSKIIHSTFMNKPYVNRINREMIPVIVTYEGVLSYPIEMYYTTVFPTLFFVDSSREVSLTEPVYGDAITVKTVETKMIELFK